MQSSPILAPFRTTAPMPMRTLSPMVQPWTTAPWPMVQPAPMRVSSWRTAQSWTFVSSPMVMAPSSPRMTALYQMFTPRPRATSPLTRAPSQIRTSASVFLSSYGMVSSSFLLCDPGGQNAGAKLPSMKMGTSSPSRVVPTMERSGVPIMKSTWVMESLRPRAFSSSLLICCPPSRQG